MPRYTDETIYHCSDEGYFCELDNSGTCNECHWNSLKGEFVERGQ